MKLRIIKGNNPGQLLNLDGKDSFLIGRVEDNDFIIDEAGVSRHHCKLSNVAGEWLAEDLNSVNGLLVNRNKISGGVILHPGDEITVFSHTFVLEDDSAIIPPPGAANDASGSIPSQENAISKDGPNYLDNGDSANQPDDYEPERKSLNVALIAKVVVLLLISATIVVLLYMLYAKPQEDGPAVTEQPVDETPAATETKKEDDAQQHVGRGEPLLAKDAGKKQADAPADTPPPPPAPPASDKSEEQDTEDSPETPATPTVFARPAPADAAPAVRESNGLSNAIVVITTPDGADVSLDGRSRGTSPLVIDDLEDGQHSLEITKPGYERLVRLVTVPGKLSAEPFTLVQKVGTLMVNSEPSGAVVREGRKIYGITPLLIEKLRAGQHELLIDRLGYEPQKATVTMTSSRGEQINVALVRSIGGISVITTPAGCDVYVDGLLMGTTEQDGTGIDSKPLKLTDLLPGQCTVRIVHPATKMFDNNSVIINKDSMSTLRSFMWIPTHKITLLNGKNVIGMLLRQNDEGIDLLNSANKRESYIKQEYTDCVELSPEEQTAAIKNRATLKEASGENTRGKSQLSVSFQEFMLRSKFPNFKQAYKGKRICITGDVTMRMKTVKGEMIVWFGNKQMRCILASTVPEEDYKKIGEMDRNKEQVSLRGEYMGEDKEGVQVIRNCVLLAMPD